MLRLSRYTVIPSIMQVRHFAPKSAALTAYTLTLQPDGAAGVDALLLEGAPNLNFGASDTWLWLGEVAGAGMRSLIKFDLSALPDNALITTGGASYLRLYCHSYTAAVESAYALYPMIRAWTEGTGNVSASGDGATWDTYDGVNNWTAPGGFHASDCGQTAIGQSATIPAAFSAPDYFDIALTVTSKAALGTAGWMIKQILPSPNVSNVQARCTSSDSGTEARRPQLVIAYLA